MASTTESLPKPAPYLRFAANRSGPDDGVSAFISVRSRLFAIAYRMLGDAAEAEDIVQEVWLRWQSTNRTAVENAPAFLATTTTRLCINVTQSARTRRETCVGTWLSEPVDDSCNPARSVEREQALKLAAMMLLEKLSPAERAVYLLREAFDTPYRQIAEMLCMEEANVRQLGCRARKRLADCRRTRAVAGKQEHRLEKLSSGITKVLESIRRFAAPLDFDELTTVLAG
jgi:RNA polymerase sigma-70 factor, ECF subfamily